MHPLAHRSVLKMNGLGNEIVILDLRGTPAEFSADAVRAIGRAERLAFDQLMLLRDPISAGTEAYVRIYNRDGSEAGACGNGMRCVAWSILHGSTGDNVRLETAAGILECHREDEWRFAVDMGEPRFCWHDIPLREAVDDTSFVPIDLGRSDAPFIGTVVNMGNPHAIFFITDLDAYDLASLGPQFEHHTLFPERANVSFAHIIDREHIHLRVWERGTGLTRACGSAACATVVAAARKNIANREANVTLPGGDLMVTWRESDNHVILTGPVELEFEATLDPLLFEDQAA